MSKHQYMFKVQKRQSNGNGLAVLAICLPSIWGKTPPQLVHSLIFLGPLLLAVAKATHACGCWAFKSACRSGQSGHAGGTVVGIADSAWCTASGRAPGRAPA